MRRRRCRAAFPLSVAVALLVAAASRASAQKGPDEEGALFLLLPVGARAVGSGQAVVGDRPGSEAVWWNPGALARLEKRELALHHSQSIVYKGDAISVVVPSSLLGTLAISFNLLDYDEIADTPADPTQPSTGKILPRNLALAASYAATLGSRVSAGVTYKLVQFRLDCIGSCTFDAPPASTSALDFGLQYDFRAAEKGVTTAGVGVALRNVGLRFQVNDRDQADPLPTRLQVGGVYRIPLPSEFMRGGEVTLTGDIMDEVGFSSPGGYFGASLGIRRRVHVRTGYSYEPAGGSSPTVGIGVDAGKLVVDVASMIGGLSFGSGEPPTFLSLRYLF